MGFNLSSQETVPLSLTLEETEVLLQRFRRADSGGKGYISLSDLERLCDVSDFLDFYWQVFVVVSDHFAGSFLF